MVKLNAEEKLELIKRNTEEIIGEDELKKLLNSEKKLTVYLGTAPTGRPHVGYFMWALKVSDLLKVGFKVKILLADLHAAMDNTPWEILEERYNYYAVIIPLVIGAMGADTKNLEFVKGSDFQLKPDYILDVLKLSSITSVHDCHKAASEVVKLGDNPKLSGLIYPLMQALDEEYLKVDAQLGGTDQRKIMVLARENLPKIGYNPRIEILNPLIPGLIGKKMSSSVEASKIDLMDLPDVVKEKLKKAEFVEGDCDNGVMAFLKHILFTIKRDKKEKLIVKRPVKFGGNLEYSFYKDLEDDVLKKNLHPLDLKNCLAEEISKLLEPINKHRKELEKLSGLAYK